MNNYQHAEKSPLFCKSNSRLWPIAMLVFAGALLASILGGCHSGPDPDKAYDSSSNGQTITIERGDTFDIRLISNISIGAKWELVELDRNIAEQVGEARPMAKVVQGGLARLYTYSYTFRAKAEGTTTLKFLLNKPGEEKPLDSYTATIVVKK